MPTKADKLREFDAQQRAINEQRAQLSEHERQLSELRVVLDEQLRQLERQLRQLETSRPSGPGLLLYASITSVVPSGSGRPDCRPATASR